jgi:hypothetical protein
MKILSQMVTSITARNPTGWLAQALTKWSRAIPKGGTGAISTLSNAPTEIVAVHNMTSIPKIMKIGVAGLGLAAAVAYGRKLWRDSTSSTSTTVSSHNPITERGIDPTYEDYIGQNYSVLLNRFSQDEIIALECLCINAIFMRPGEFTKLHLDRGHFEDHREAMVRMRSVALSSWHNTHHRVNYHEYDELIKGLVDSNFEQESQEYQKDNSQYKTNEDTKTPPENKKTKLPNSNGDAINDALNKYKDKGGR